jgi:glyoxylase-like metal-dependent hydrolase (beta-lactamase superfamily II)
MDPDDEQDPMVKILRDRHIPAESYPRIAANLARTELVQGQLPASLAALGVTPEEVTDVIFTHLHFDHIGWASAHGRPFFPHATIRCAEADMAYFRASEHEEDYTAYVYSAARVVDRFEPVRDRVETWDGDGPILPGVDVRLAPGHTPGSSVVVVSDGDARAMILGDVVHCPLELMDDDFNLFADHDQEMANKVRQAYARELEGSDVLVSASHFPGLQFGRLLPGTGLRHFVFGG